MNPTDEVLKAVPEILKDMKGDDERNSVEVSGEFLPSASSRKLNRNSKAIIAQDKALKQSARRNGLTEPTPDMLEHVGQELTGHIKWYNVQKSYGWIVPDKNVGGDIFVHQSNLVMEGFRSAAEEQQVKFYLQLGTSGIEAINVRGLNGPLLSHPERPLPRKLKETTIRCYKCGRAGNHLARDCKTIKEEVTVCYLCKQTGHIRKNCPEKRNKPPTRSPEKQEDHKRRRDEERDCNEHQDDTSDV